MFRAIVPARNPYLRLSRAAGRGYLGTMAKWIFWILVATTVVLRADTPSGEDLIRKIAVRDKELVAHRKAFDYDIAITRDKLNDDTTVASSETETVTMRGNVSPNYHTRDADKPEEVGQAAVARGAVRAAQDHRPLHLHGRGQ